MTLPTPKPSRRRASAVALAVSAAALVAAATAPSPAALVDLGGATSIASESPYPPDLAGPDRTWFITSRADRMVPLTEELDHGAPIEDPDGELAAILEEIQTAGTRSLYVENVIAKAELQLSEGALEAASDSVNQAIEMDPLHAKAYTLRGIISAIGGEHGDAKADFERSLQFDPNLALTYYARGESNRRVGQIKDAIRDFTVAVRIDGRYAEAYMKRGIAHGEAGSPDLAILDFSRYIELAPGDPSGYRNRAVAYRRHGNRAAAEADLEKAKAIRDGGVESPDAAHTSAP